MKIVVNRCYGGFSLSPLAVQRLAKLHGKECYFFKSSLKENGYIPISLEQAEKELFWSAYFVPDPQNYKLGELDEDGFYKSANERAEKISISYMDIRRDDSNLIKVVEELGDKANGRYAELQIVEIPDGIKWEIEEYAGLERVSEKHRTW